MADTNETLRKLVEAGVPPETARVLAKRLKGTATEKDVLRSLGFH